MKNDIYIPKYPWDRFGGKKYAALWFGIIIPQFVVIAAAFTMGMIWKIEMGFNFAKWFCGFSLVGILSYAGVNVWQKKVKNNNNNPK